MKLHNLIPPKNLNVMLFMLTLMSVTALLSKAQETINISPDSKSKNPIMLNVEPIKDGSDQLRIVVSGVAPPRARITATLLYGEKKDKPKLRVTLTVKFSRSNVTTQPTSWYADFDASPDIAQGCWIDVYVDPVDQVRDSGNWYRLTVKDYLPSSSTTKPAK